MTTLLPRRTHITVVERIRGARSVRAVWKEESPPRAADRESLRFNMLFSVYRSSTRDSLTNRTPPRGKPGYVFPQRTDPRPPWQNRRRIPDGPAVSCVYTISVFAHCGALRCIPC